MTLRISLVAVCCSSASVRSLVARLQLLEQADVLDGDDGLVGEGRDELDLLVGERLDSAPRTMNTPTTVALPEHRDGEDGPDLGAALPLGPAVLGIGHGVVDVDDAALEERPARRRTPDRAR